MAEVTAATWTEFVAAAAIEGDTVIVPPGTVWDLDRIAPQGLDSSVLLYANVKGNGLTIRNIRSNIVTFELANKAPNISDLHFENIMQTGGAFFKSSLTWATNVHAEFHNCSFAGTVTDAIFLDLSRTGAIFSSDGDLSCGFELDFGGSGIFANTHYDIGTIISDCKLQFGGSSTGANTRCKLSNCAILGTQPWSNWEIGTLVTSTVNLHVSSEQSLSATVTTSAINTDLAKGTISGDFLRVTDAQMRDADYLASLGFPIGDDASG